MNFSGEGLINIVGNRRRKTLNITQYHEIVDFAKRRPYIDTSQSLVSTCTVVSGKLMKTFCWHHVDQLASRRYQTLSKMRLWNGTASVARNASLRRPKLPQEISRATDNTYVGNKMDSSIDCFLCVLSSLTRFASLWRAATRRPIHAVHDVGLVEIAPP